MKTCKHVSHNRWYFEIFKMKTVLKLSMIFTFFWYPPNIEKYMLLGSKKKNKLCCKQCTNFANKETSCCTTQKKKTCTTRQKQHKFKKKHITKANEIDSMLVSRNKNKETQKWWHLQHQINKKKKKKGCHQLIGLSTQKKWQWKNHM